MSAVETSLSPALDSPKLDPQTPNMNLLMIRLLAMVALAMPMWASEAKSLFDGKTLHGWEGDSKIWSVQEGAITAGRVDQRARSERIPNHHEMIGYQADIGEGWYGALYDESRRNTILAKPDPETVQKAVKPGQWNHYEIRATGNRVILKINGIQTVDYTEKDPKVVPHGKLAVQIHGDGKTRVQFKDLSIEELP